VTLVEKMFIFALKSEQLFVKTQEWPLLKKFFRLRIDQLERIHDPLLVEALYKSFYVQNGTSKETRKGRFSEIDEITLSLLDKSSENVIHDVAVSSGVTSLELYQKLARNGFDFKLYISDKFSRYYYTGDNLRRIYDCNHALTQAYILSFLSDKHLHWKHFFSKYSYHLIRLLPDKKKVEGNVLLYDPEVLSVLRVGEIYEIEYDIFASQFNSQFDLVRCMNTLNLAYFAASDISNAINNLKLSLKDGGLLQVGRTSSSGTNNVSYFRKVGDSLCWIEDTNGGSEIKELIG
jgi:hypothetical protein